MYWRVLREVRNHNTVLREKIKKKTNKKIEFLRKKYGKSMRMMDAMTDEEKKLYEGAKIFGEVCDMRGEPLREPEVVNGKNDDVKLTEGKIKVLSLGPKFCVRNDLNEEAFEVALEECITKIRWDLRSEEENKNKYVDMQILR